MITRKVCLLGAFAVGKTSLVRRFVKGVFNEEYLTTLGVKIDTKTVQPGEVTVKMIVWDIEGADPDDQDSELVNTRMQAYLQGVHGILLVVDGTRTRTLEVARQLHDWLGRERPGIPAVLLLNKHDLQSEWKISEAEQASLSESLQTFTTSASSGDNVERSFEYLAELMSRG